MLVLISLGLFMVCLLLIVVWAAYGHTLPLELKRQARAGNYQANQLYQVVAYGPVLPGLLMGIVGIASAGALVLLVRSVMSVVALPVAALFVWVGFVWLPARNFNWGTTLAVWLSPLLAKILSYLYPVTSLVSAWRPGSIPTLAPSDIFETEDLLGLLENQKQAPHNRIPGRQLEAASHVLQFSHLTVAQTMLPRLQVKLVASSDSIGPLLLDELHDSGQRSFLVYEGVADHIVGVINLHDALGAVEGARASDVMRSNVCFINEAQSLEEVLQAFEVTRQPVFVVVNRANDFVGIIGIEHLLAEALGQVSPKEPLAYEDRSVMAAYQPVFEPIVVPEEEPLQEPEQLQELNQDQVAEVPETLPPEPPEVVE